MSLKHLGEKFDIHGGGSDLVFPHHEAEIFQSECCLGHDPVVQYWLHNGMINIDGEKMSKSVGNFWTVSDALEKIEPLVLRYALINAPYRQPVDFNSVMIDDSISHHGRLLSSYSEALYYSEGIRNDYSGIEHLDEATRRIRAGMDDDFNTRIALVEIQSVVKSLTSLIDSDEKDPHLMSAYVQWLEKFAGEVLGILPTPSVAISLHEEKISRRSEISTKVESLLEMRESARASKNWPESDRIRDELTEMGVVVEDSPDGTKWRIS
jgi:cysteinyl-tRNA synthetase